jgi:hypothetical protein
LLRTYLMTAILAAISAAGWLLGLHLSDRPLASFIACGSLALGLARWPTAKPTPRLLRAIANSAYTFLGLLYFASIKLGATGFDAAFFWHLELETLRVASSQWTLIVGGCGLLAFTFFLSYLNPVASCRRAWIIHTIPLATLAWNPLLDPLARIAPGLTHPTPTPIEEFASKNSIDLKQIRMPERPKSLVLIYMETFERTFMDPSLFGDAAQPLLRLESEGVSFRDFQQMPGAAWTAAGMFSSQCALPLSFSFKMDVNTLLTSNDNLAGGILCLGDILKSLDYQTHFLTASFENFGGKRQVLSRHGIDHFSGATHIESSLPLGTPSFLWGYHDDALFTAARGLLSKLSVSEKPFWLTLEAVDMHGPGGFPSPNCDATGVPQEDDFTRALRCSSEQVARFVREIRSDPRFQDTVVVVMGDHLAFPNNTHFSRIRHTNRRVLFDIWGKDIAPAIINNPISHFDVGPTLLDYLGIEGAPTWGLGQSQRQYSRGLVLEKKFSPAAIASVRLDKISSDKLPRLPAYVSIELDKSRISFGDVTMNLRSYFNGSCKTCSWIFLFDSSGKFSGMRLVSNKSVDIPNGTRVVMAGYTPSLVAHYSESLRRLPSPFAAYGIVGQGEWRFTQGESLKTIPANMIRERLAITPANSAY